MESGEESSDDSSSDEEEDDTTAYRFSVPANFELLPKPESLPTDIEGLFVLFLFTFEGWCLGKIREYKPRAKKLKYVIVYNDGSIPTQLQLDNYYEGEKEPSEDHTDADAGLWVLLRKCARMED